MNKRLLFSHANLQYLSFDLIESGVLTILLCLGVALASVWIGSTMYISFPSFLQNKRKQYFEHIGRKQSMQS